MTVRDPICGRTIGIGDAAASIDHEGWAYFFCSAQCELAFKADPARFATEHPTGAQNKKERTHNA